MPKRLLVSLILALALITGAVWSRYARTSGSAYGTLVATSTTAAVTESQVEDLAAIYTSQATTSTTTEQLTDTDLVVRQLFSDYLTLSANGQATQANLDALGDKYAAAATLTSKAPAIGLDDLKVVETTHASLSTYAVRVSAIYDKYHALLASQVKPNANYSDYGLDLIHLSTSFADAYAKAASELEALPVPQALADAHLRYTNLYLRRAWDMKAIANLNSDPVTAAAAISSETQVITDERAVATEIQQLLVSNGIIISNP